MTVVLNDLHLGAVRKGGTTPASQAALRAYQYEQFESLLSKCPSDLIINGDLFDGFMVDPSDVIMTFQTLADWFKHVANPHCTLTLVAGNHDWNPRGGKTSSFHLLCHFLKTMFPDNVQVIDYEDGFAPIYPSIWAIPHMPNQALFDLEIEKAISGPTPGWLLLHANYNNSFAVHADHSLNVSQDQIDRLMLAGWFLLFAHEHQHRVMRGGRVVIAGNQIPTSVADCLGCNGKYYTELVGPGVAVIHRFIDLPEIYREIDWRELNADDAKFIRVVGEATAEEASAVVDAVAKFRQSSQAYVVSNATKIDGVAGFDALAEVSLEQINAFSVLDSLLEELTEEEGVIVKGLLDNA